MRAKEFIVEDEEVSGGNGTTEHYNGIDVYFEDYGDGEIFVQALANGKELGYVLFVEEDDYLVPEDLQVNERFRGQGVAQTMYDYVKSKGYTIQRSPDQTDAGAGFWNKHRGEDVRVWEDVNPDIYHSEFKHEVEMHGYRYTAETDNNSGYGNQLIIKVYDGNKEIANAEFYEEPHDKALISMNTWVINPYKGQGIATNMYAYAKMLGNDVMPSDCQTDQGERMWRSWNQSGQSKHILPKGHKGYN